MNEIKLCKDCVFFRPALFGYPYNRCAYGPKIDLVTGETIYEYADSQRTHNCGREGRYFERIPEDRFRNARLSAVLLALVLIVTILSYL